MCLLDHLVYLVVLLELFLQVDRQLLAQHRVRSPRDYPILLLRVRVFRRPLLAEIVCLLLGLQVLVIVDLRL